MAHYMVQKHMAQKTQKTFWIYGNHAVLAALHHQKRQKLAFYYCKQPLAESFNILAQQSGVTPHYISTDNLSQLIAKDDQLNPHHKIIHQGVALKVAPLTKLSALDFIAAPPKPYQLLLLDGLEDVQNIGAILRSAYLLGVDAVIAPEWQESGHLARAAAGALEMIPLLTTGNISQLMDRLRQQDFWFSGLDMAGDDIGNATVPERHVMIMGREGKGLHQLIKKKCDFLYRIPMQENLQIGAPDSFNVSVSTAIALYALKRNRNDGK